MANVLCRLPNPRAALQRIAGKEEGVIAPGGLLMLTTPFSWKEEFTPKSSWLGGVEGGEDSLTALKGWMNGLGYTLVKEEEMPLVIRQHRRLYELIGAQATVWRREE